MGLFNEPPDAGEGGGLPNRLDTNPDGRIGRDRSGDDLITGPRDDRIGLPSDHGQVDLG